MSGTIAAPAPTHPAEATLDPKQLRPVDGEHDHHDRSR